MAGSPRERFIETTCTLLELQGYNATGINQIIRESGAPRGSLYYYFPAGKDQLTAEALNHVSDLILERIRTNLEAVEDPAEAVRAFILKVAHSVEATGYQAGGPITTVALETASTHETLREVCRAIYADWQQAFAEKLQTALPEARARRLAQVIIAALEGGILLSRTERSPEPLESVAHEVGLLIEACIGPDGG